MHGEGAHGALFANQLGKAGVSVACFLVLLAVLLPEDLSGRGVWLGQLRYDRREIRHRLGACPWTGGGGIADRLQGLVRQLHGAIDAKACLCDPGEMPGHALVGDSQRCRNLPCAIAIACRKRQHVANVFHVHLPFLRTHRCLPLLRFRHGAGGQREFPR